MTTVAHSRLAGCLWSVGWGVGPIIATTRLMDFRIVGRFSLPISPEPPNPTNLTSRLANRM